MSNRRVSSSSKHIPHPSKHVRLSAALGATIPNLLLRAGKAGPEEIGARNGKEEREREAAVGEVVLEAGEARAQLHREDARPGRLVLCLIASQLRV